MRAAPFHLVAPELAEHDLQISCTDKFWTLLLPAVVWTAVDLAGSLDMRPGRNGRPIGLQEAAKRKRRGCRKGVSDYLFWHDRQAFAMELKVGDAQPDADQKAFLRGMIAAGHQVKVCWTEPQVFKTLAIWRLLRPHTVQGGWQ